MEAPYQFMRYVCTLVSESIFMSIAETPWFWFISFRDENSDLEVRRPQC